MKVEEAGKGVGFEERCVGGRGERGRWGEWGAKSAGLGGCEGCDAKIAGVNRRGENRGK